MNTLTIVYYSKKNILKYKIIKIPNVYRCNTYFGSVMFFLSKDDHLICSDYKNSFHVLDRSKNFENLCGICKTNLSSLKFLKINKIDVTIEWKERVNSVLCDSDPTDKTHNKDDFCLSLFDNS
jgi:hypothetical protein